MTVPVAHPAIPLLDLRRQTAAIRPEIDAAIANVLDHGQFILGPEVGILEESIARYCGTRFAIACASGSDALLLPLMAMDIGPGHRVIVPPFTFFATAGSVAQVGATPVFVDIDPETFNIDPAALARYLEGCTREVLRTVRAIVPVHLFGHCADMEAINALGARFGIPIIEDAAQAIGAEFEGVRAGAQGLCGAFSFFPTKNLGGFGDGGIVTTNDSALAEKLRLLRVHGSGATYYHKYAGINSRLDTMQAAILLVKLRHLDGWTENRRDNALSYRKHLAHLNGSALQLPVERGNVRHVYNQFTIRVRNRDEVRQRLSDARVASAVYYPLPLHLQECFTHLGHTAGDFPVSEAACREVLSLPIESGLTSAQIEIVADILSESLKARE